MCVCMAESLPETIKTLLFGYTPIQNKKFTKKTMEKEMATHSSMCVWKSPWTEESGGLKSMGLHD